MAITINGTGSITGLTAGGLPDGSVTAADIETSLDLTGKTVTLPSGTGGKILQVVSATTSTQVTNTTSTYADSGLTDSITPVAAGSSILVLTSQSFYFLRTGNGEGVRVQLVRGSTVIFGADAVDQYLVIGGASSVYQQARNAMTYLDTPTYTLGDAITYKTQFRPELTEARAQSGSQESSIVLIEVAA